MLSNLFGDAKADEDSESLSPPLITMEESVEVLRPLIQSCYPVRVQLHKNIDTLLKIYEAAHKYDLLRSQDLVAKHLIGL
jgi:hypothetical protein